ARDTNTIDHVRSATGNVGAAGEPPPPPPPHPPSTTARADANQPRDLVTRSSSSRTHPSRSYRLERPPPTPRAGNRSTSSRRAFDPATASVLHWRDRAQHRRNREARFGRVR